MSDINTSLSLWRYQHASSLLVGAIVLLVIGGISLVIWYYQQQKAAAPVTHSKGLFQAVTRDDHHPIYPKDFLHAIPEETLQEEIPKETKEALPPLVDLSPLFEQESVPEPEKSRFAKEAGQGNMQTIGKGRNDHENSLYFPDEYGDDEADDGGDDPAVSSSNETSGVHIPAWWQRNRDLNFNAQQEPKTTPSYPVDLSRVITMNKFIPAVLMTQIHSELGSEKVIARVTEDITGFHGTFILIPRGSDVIGRYQPLGSNGERRLALKWYRIITPQGINISLMAEAADAIGKAGITGDIDYRLKEKYGAAVLFATINAAAQLSVPEGDIAMRSAVNSGQQQFAEITKRAVEDGLNIAPVVTIPYGTPITISPLTDIWFKQSNDLQYQAVPLPPDRVLG